MHSVPQEETQPALEGCAGLNPIPASGQQRQPAQHSACIDCCAYDGLCAVRDSGMCAFSTSRVDQARPGTPAFGQQRQPAYHTVQLPLCHVDDVPKNLCAGSSCVNKTSRTERQETQQDMIFSLASMETISKSILSAVQHMPPSVRVHVERRRCVHMKVSNAPNKVFEPHDCSDAER